MESVCVKLFKFIAPFKVLRIVSIAYRHDIFYCAPHIIRGIKDFIIKYEQKNHCSDTIQHKRQEQREVKHSMGERLYSGVEIAARYGVDKRTLYDWLRRGRLRVITAGRRYLIPENALAEFERENAGTKRRRTG